MKIIHFSDTHIGRQHNEARFELLLQDMALIGNPEEFIVIHTGDLIDQGNDQERAAGINLLEQWSAKGWRILLVPGNHDCGNAMHVDPDVAQQFKLIFSKFIFGTKLPKFPVLNIIDDCAFIGLDSNQEEMGWVTRWFAEGNLGNQQIAELSNMLDSAEVADKFKVVYLHHHPFFDAPVVAPDKGDSHFIAHFFNWNTRRFRRLKDAYTLMQCVRDRIDGLLFGHQHYGYNYSAEGQRYGISFALDGSSSTCTEMDTDRMRYRIIDTVTGTISIRSIKLITPP